ncbi:MAG: phosphoglucosamine mutase [Acidimicrobiales bacterium]
MALKFGTDGVRGLANTELSPELVMGLGRAAAGVFGPASFLLARDTRRSGPLLQAALAAGLASAGCDVVDLGVLPTPGLAWAAAESARPAAMISASHNPFADNGIKFIDSAGIKIPPAAEARLEAELGVLMGPVRPDGGPHGEITPVVGADVGYFITDFEARDRYADHLVASLEGRRLHGTSVVLDCANGAAFALAPSVFERLGANVIVISSEPDGTNINHACGSTHPEALSRSVLSAGADLGLAFDGDADRVLAVDGHGQVVDGDHLLALFARDMSERGCLAGDAVVVTVMTNLGFHHAMDEAGIKVVQTGVGDRLVFGAITDGGFSLGGEQSGHIIFRDLATTGDGILTGLALVDLVRRSGTTLANLARGAMTRLPQELHNVVVPDPDRLDAASAVWEEVAAVEAELGGTGRVLLRRSGTERLVRVMVEAPTPERAQAAALRLARVVESELG